MQRLLVLSHQYPPSHAPLAKRAWVITNALAKRYVIDVLTSQSSTTQGSNPIIHTVQDRGRVGGRALNLPIVRRIKEVVHFSDFARSWVAPATRKGDCLHQSRGYSAVIGFMMPYSCGVAAAAIARKAQIPLILNFNDSLTCPDMHAVFPTKFHYSYAVQLERRLLTQADRAVFVTESTLRRVQRLHGRAIARKLAFIRCGSLSSHIPTPLIKPVASETFEILYLGDFGGWHACLDQVCPPSALRRLCRQVERVGRFEQKHLNLVGHSPLPIGLAIDRLIRRHPEWRGKIRLRVIGSSYPRELTDHVLRECGIAEWVYVQPKVPFLEAIAAAHQADALFLSLPAQPVGGFDHRVSSKTYDYLMTSRPILAAVPEGENRNLLSDVPGVVVVDPLSCEDMMQTLEKWGAAVLNERRAITCDRTHLRRYFDYASIAEEFAGLVEDIIG